MRFICLVILVLVVACDGRQSRKEVLGDGSAKKQLELQSVLDHYKNSGDTLRYDAALFLIRNMPGLASVDLVQKIEQPDVQYITAQYLIDNIDLAFKQSEKSLKDGSLPFRNFCEYVLPYRLGNEPLSDWRGKGIFKYGVLIDSTSHGSKDGIKYENIISKINSELIDHFTYSSKSKPANFQTWEQLMDSKTGDCWAMTNTITYPLRAIGIPTAIDFITNWGNSNGGGHAWNALVVDSGKDVPFLGFEASPPDYNPFKIYKSAKRYPPKIFRKTFSKNPEALSSLIGIGNVIHGNLNFDRFVDVTDHYLPTKNVKVTLKNQVPPTFAYLTVFSNGYWQPVYWAKLNSGSFVFDKMATGLLYLPSSFDNIEGIKFIGYPFGIVNNEVVQFKPQLDLLTDIKITHRQSLELDALSLYGLDISKDTFYQRIEAVMSGKNRSMPLNGETYKLFYWDNDWVLVGEKQKVTGKELIFANVPVNAIYRLLSSDSNGKERIFSFTDKQIWW